MDDNRRNIAEISECEFHGTIITKWFQILFVSEIGRMVITATNFISDMSSVTGWISRVVSVVIIFALFHLVKVNERYRKAAILYCISVGGSIVLTLLNTSIFALALSVCYIIASYHELIGHSEITTLKDAKLSDRWRSLFYLDMFAGIMVGVLSIIPMMIAMLAGVDEYVVISIFSIVLNLINLVIRLLHVVYLKQTISLYQK